MRHSGGNTNNIKGFTLIELILSLALLSLVLTTVFSLYTAGQKAYERENDRLFVQQNARQAFLWLSTSVKQAKSVEIISEKEIKTITGNKEVVIYYLENGMLYRKKNTGINPIAELSQLKFIQPKGKNYIEIFLSTETESGNIVIRTKAAPFGSWID
ncbi:MAG TPA: prepilin-type N-terminal cleavage/methylation domain-containing protein [Thermoanaerobacterales bacterium]|nr:prepilin-type N-terminal cleavage/methylation domain-containing protein [Thermoanaerobacterales bacterium]